ncbi:MAG: DoxX family protein [Betaproteobacteria bacterium]|nr:DoxX family protein [Betaproteobacteria bacterium]
MNPDTAACRLSAGRWLGSAWTALALALDWLQAPALLAARLYVADVFFASGLESLRRWGATVWLYQNMFQVPLLPPDVAAVAGTAGELLLPPLVAFGLFGRFGALGLFVVNLVAFFSYLHTLPAPSLTPAAMFHAIWGILIALVALWGPGRWSVDGWWAAQRRTKR